MPIEFDIKLTAEDMFRFNMYQTYSGTQGWLSVFCALLLFAKAASSAGEVPVLYTVLFALCGIVFLLYLPLVLKLRSGHAINASGVLQNALHYQVDEKGFTVTQGEASAELLWEQIYKMSVTKRNVLVYSNRTNAYVIPRAQLGVQYEALRALAKEKLPAYRAKLK